MGKHRGSSPRNPQTKIKNYERFKNHFGGATHCSSAAFRRIVATFLCGVGRCYNMANTMFENHRAEI
jgi:hypothetical protein